ncbi:MAG: OmpA family protein [Bacteroidota bacterium]
MAPSGADGFGPQSFQPAAQLSVSKYLAAGFDFHTQLIYSPKVTFPALDGASWESPIIDMNYLLAFKVNNGLFLKESSRIGPYIMAGIGGSYVSNNPDAYLPIGGGVRVRFNQRLSLNLQTMRKFSVNKDVQNIAHAIAFIYNIDPDQIDLEDLKPGEIDEEILVSALIPRDADHDGLVDHEDKCPYDPGIIAYTGCPTQEGLDEALLAIADTTPLTSDTPLDIADAIDSPLESDLSTGFNDTDSSAMAIVEDIAEPAEETSLTDEDSEDFSMESVAVVTAKKPEANDMATVSQPEEETDLTTAFSGEELANEPVEEESIVASAAAEGTTEEPGGLFFEETDSSTSGDPVSETPEAEMAAVQTSEDIAPIEPEDITPLNEASPGEEDIASVQDLKPEAPRPEVSTLEDFPCTTYSDQAVELDPVFFDLGSDDLPEDAIAQLAQIATVMKSCSSSKLMLNGHADATGGEKDNLVLSIMRAFNVKYYLVYEHGISQQRIVSKGLGEDSPVAQNDTNDGRQQNRRVEFQLMF